MSLSVTLHPSQVSQNEPRSISAFVDRLYRQRGSMREVTEDSLREGLEDEAIEGDGGSTAGEDTGAEEEAPEDLDGRIKSLGSARDRMLDLVGEASNEVLMLQDFVSLLVSRDRPQAATTMSPALKELVPPGSFAFDRNPTPSIEESRVESAQTEADALQFQSINAAADRLLNSANSLELQIGKEVKYWEQILSVSDRGWNITKIRGPSHTLGVRYSCPEAAPQFHARGIASLKIADDGNLTLDRGTASDTKALRLRVVEDGRVTETSSISGLIQAENSTLDEVVNQGRDSLFDEELHHELAKEGRHLLAYGVRVASGNITIPLTTPEATKARRALLIDLIDRGDPVTAQGTLAPILVQYLRLGLNHEYRKRYRSRTSVPAPISKSLSTEIKGSALLQSIFCLDQHRQAVLGPLNLLKHLSMSIKSAGLDTTLDMNNRWLPSDKATKKQGARQGVHSDAVDDFFDIALGDQSSTCSLGLPSSLRLLLHIRTSLSGPLYGTRYYIEKVTANGVESLAREVDSAAEAIERFNDVAPRIILEHLAAHEPAWSLHASKPELLNVRDQKRRVTILISKGAIGVMVGIEGSGKKARVHCMWDGERIDVAIKGGANKLQSILLQTDEGFSL